MSDQPGDSLLRQLGQLARERDAAEADTDSRKKAPRDTLAEDSLAEDSLAKNTAPPGDWERQAAKPLDAKAQQRIVRRLEQVIAEEFPDDREKGAALQNSTGPPTAFRARAKRLPAWLAWPAAAALLLAVSLFALRVALGPRNVNQEPNLVADLPTYSMTVEGLTRFQRGSQEDPEIESPGSSVERKEIALGNQLRVTLTPGEAYSGSLKGRAFFSCEGPWQQLPDEVLALSAQGALRLQATMGEEIPAVPGDKCELLVILGHPSALASREEAFEASFSTGEGAGEGWWAALLALEVRP